MIEWNDRDHGDDKRTRIERLLRGMVGHGYRTGMRASPLLGRLREMKADLDAGHDTAEHKLKYLLWFN